jgi:hypothetical protein
MMIFFEILNNEFGLPKCKQVLTPTCKGPWGEGGDLVALKEWNEQFRKADPIINTPKASYPVRLPSLHPQGLIVVVCLEATRTPY